ncbi:MAG TPA: LexA family transcriptional regulator [Bacteroides sp.]|nr:LexA family transcriptional regulator [Bacteroides sp.]
MHFSQNIKLLRKRRNRTQDELSHILGMRRSTLSGYENEVAEPGIHTLMAFSKYFGVAVDTLIRIDLAGLSESQLSELERGNDIYLRGSKLRVLATTVDNENEENIELVNEKAKAGYTNGFADPEFIQQLPTFQLPFLSPAKKYRTFQLSGDSMLPIPDRSWVTGEFLQDWKQIRTGEAYVILTLDDGIVFKVAENLLEKEHKLTLYSLNPIYEPFDVNVNEIKEVWKFNNYISAEIPEPVTPEEELLKTVANLKQDMARIKKQILPGRPEA